MNFPSAFTTRNFKNARERCIQHSRLDAKRHAVVTLGALLFAIGTPDLSAQVGDNNPGGNSGIFNGQINTGCSYDPYTGNATRSITDIAVASAVGEYPLALVRTANSRAPSTTEVFGFAGGWNHNYNWILEESEHSQTQNFYPASYTVEFPDGRVETFRQVNWDTCYRVRASNGDAGSAAGARERFLTLNLSSLFAYLVLPDGGAIEFKAVQYTNGNHNRWWYKYHATAIYDPHGLKTQLVSSTTDNGVWRRLDWVIEPAGRSLHFIYTGTNSPRIASVTASDGRTVNYSYVSCNGCWLDNVVYYNNANWTAHYQYVGSNTSGELPPLLRTADDPMYPGAMKRIAYEYKPGTPGDPSNPDGTRPVYGQILRERYWDGVSAPMTGPMISELTVGEAPNVTWKRIETRGDTKTRSFTYTTDGYLTNNTDFMSHGASQGYDNKKYVNYVIDRRNNRTDYINDPITGNVLQIQFPFTHEDTQNQSVPPTVNYVYGGGAGCSNNQNPYWLCSATDEAGNQTQFTRDPVTYRPTRIDYPDGGWETFSYDAAHFYQLSSHRMKTGGTETFAYDGLHRLQYYSDPYHNNTNSPSMTYYYDGLDRISGMVDALNHSTNFDYNDRGQITLTTLPLINGPRYTISNLYYPDGTLQKRTDELGHFTTFTYDDYRRLKSVTPPARDGTHTTQFYYGVNAIDNVADYRYTDSNVTYVVPPSTGTKKIKTVYDDNRRKQSTILAPSTAAEATTSYGYDNADNVTTVTNLRNRSTTAIYDERNRPSEIHDPYNNITSFTYDTAGRLKTITRPNGQVITNASFDEMNRVLQQNVTQTPGPLAVTKYTYYPSGLLNTMTDPYNSTDSYTYVYDLMGRKLNLTYPADSNGNHSVERFTYDTAGRLDTFKNRSGKTQTFTYDALNRITQSSWDDNGTTPTVTFSYDATSRMTAINNANANISRAYFDDNLLQQETETITGGRPKTVSYTYDADANRANVTYPDYATFAYTYTARNQLQNVGPWATYAYDENGYTGDLTTRTLNNSTHTSYNYDALDRVTWITHSLTSGVRGFNYGYDGVSVGNRKFIRRTGTTLGDKGDVFGYDLADQAIGVGLNVTTPQSTPAPARSIFYDANGNRTTFRPYGPTDTYVTNNLNQYTSRNSNNAAYNGNGDMIVTPEPAGSRSTYSFDAQNRVTSAGKGNVTMYFNYDGLNRQVSRTVGGVTTYNVWDGWDLIEEYGSGGTVTAKYVYGVGGLIKELVNNRYYYQDGSGSTSHIANSSGVLQEWYRYDLHGAPFFYNASDTQLSASALGVRHLFTAQQWYSQLGLYDLRNRFYSSDLGRFLQPDPVGFRGGNNLYRYCGNNPATRWDPFGLQSTPPTAADPVRVTGSEIPPPEIPYIPEFLQRPLDLSPLERVGSSNPGSGGDGGAGGGGGRGGRGGTRGTGFNSAAQQSSPPQQNPPSPTLANSPATTLLGKFLQSFNSQGGWSEMADAMDTFAGLAASSLFFGEGEVNWAVGRYVLGPSVRTTFSRGTIQSTVLRRPLTVFRYWGGESQRYGSYLTTADTVSQISSSNAASIALALPEGNTAATLTRFTLPAGTRVWTGGIAGGADTATQVYVLNPDVFVIGGL